MRKVKTRHFKIFLETARHRVPLSGMATDELLTPEESAKYLKMHVDSVRRLLRTSKLPGKKVGGGWRIPKSALVEMLRSDVPATAKGGASNGAVD
jgi:excisionase family DNA binding protein